MDSSSHFGVQLTPRSKEAFKRLGYQIEDITPISKEEINRKYGDNNTNRKLIQKRV
jgi:hypothetical protein